MHSQLRSLIVTAMAWVRPLAQEFPHTVSTAKKKRKEERKKKNTPKQNPALFRWSWRVAIVSLVEDVAMGGHAHVGTGGIKKISVHSSGFCCGLKTVFFFFFFFFWLRPHHAEAPRSGNKPAPQQWHKPLQWQYQMQHKRSLFLYHCFKKKKTKQQKNLW